jgi:hypothetical protein
LGHLRDTGIVTEPNLFSMLSAYRPGSPASPFENYCTTGLAYFLQRGHRMLAALFAHVAGVPDEQLAVAEVQPRLGDAGYADLLLTYEGGARVVVEVQVESGADERHLSGFEGAVHQWSGTTRFVLLGLSGDRDLQPWTSMSWMQVVEALDDDPDPAAQQFVAFVLHDIMGLGDVSLDQALTTNRLYALGAAALRRKYGDRVSYMNTASRPLQGRYRYLGTSFALDGGDFDYWVGVVNEEIPPTEHFHLMIASKGRRLSEPVPKPRATGDWKDWAHWTGLGRVVRPITVDSYDKLLDRMLPE